MVIVIVGPTGCGKTGVSIEIAKEIRKKKIGGFLGAEIISADSRAIYKGMDIGTAKPTIEEQKEVQHWGIDLVSPDERFTVADWKMYAERKIKEIVARGNVPIIVGGTGLYVDALVYDYKFQGLGLNKKVKRDESGEYPDRKEICPEYRIFGIKTDMSILRERLKKRAHNLFVQPLFDETRELVKKYDWDCQAMKSNIYQFSWGYMNKKYTLEEAISLNVLDDYHLAKRQMTWFKRNKSIIWVPLEKVKQSVLKCIQNEQGK